MQLEKSKVECQRRGEGSQGATVSRHRVRQRRRGAGALTVTSQGIVLDRRHHSCSRARMTTLSCFQDAAIKPCCKLPHVTVYPLQHVSQGLIPASAITGLYTPNSGGHGPVAPQGLASPPSHRSADHCLFTMALPTERLGKRPGVHQSDG